MKRRRRKKEKVRGHRTHGKGNTKNRRGAGSRGGSGRAGSHKHKFSKYYADFGGQKAMKPAKKERSINVDILLERIPKWLEKGKVKEEAGAIKIDGRIIGFDKILGRGKVEKKLFLVNIKTTKSAAEKIKSAGGVIGSESPKAGEEKPAGTGEKEKESGEEESVENEKV